MEEPSPFRALPGVDTVARAPLVAAMGVSETLRAEAARHAVERARAEIAAGRPAPSVEAIASAAAAYLQRVSRPTLTPVLNATGIVVHTNLGRAPLAPGAVARALGPCTLEYDLVRGRRGSRRVVAERLLTELSGAEAALVVNNNAAAVVLMLAALARGGRVPISRGELVEIGGSFRVPEIMAAAGVTLVEVGTTNRTYARDYAAACGGDTRAILRVHPSNYLIEGFTHRPTIADLATVARDHGVPLLVDLGSDTFGPLPPFLRDDEDNHAVALAAGADVVCFSGDKLLGGPQAGILLGKRAAIDRLARYPLARAMRADKLTLAALETTLLAYRTGAYDTVPVARMLHLSEEALRQRTHAVAAALTEAGVPALAERCSDAVGGGSLPGRELPGWAVVLPPSGGAQRLCRSLRESSPPVIAVIAEDRVWLHLRTVPPDADAALVAAVTQASSQ